MNTPSLSPPAQAKLDELMPIFNREENWNLAYLKMLNDLAAETIPDLRDVEVKGQGSEALKKSHEEHAVAVELKAYAIGELGDCSAELANFPETVPLAELQSRLMPGNEVSERKKRFKVFLRCWAESHVDECMELHPLKIARKDYVAKMADDRLRSFGDEIPPSLQRELTIEFRDWSRRENYKETLAPRNAKREASVAAKLDELLKLLPATTRPHKGFSRKQWESRALKKRIVGSKSTFTRWKGQLKGRYLVSETGRKYYRNGIE